MKYKIDDIDFSSITSLEFENLCYDLLIKYNYHSLFWRQGGADNGRDIEAKLSFNTLIKNHETVWFFECKLYSGGVPPSELNTKLMWADAEKPDYLIFFISSYITNGARTWLEKMMPQKHYKIYVIEGEELKNRLLNYPELIERYFSLSRYEKLFKDIRDYKTKFNINPSFEFLVELINNIEIARLNIDDIGFILIEFYNQYTLFESRNYLSEDFEGTEANRILTYLKQSITNQELNSIKQYENDYSELGGYGIFEEMTWLDDDEYKMKLYNFQSTDLHLNYKKEQDKWKIGHYLFILFEDVAFEIFQVEETEIRIINDFKPEKLIELSIKLPDDIVLQYNNYLSSFRNIKKVNLPMNLDFSNIKKR